MSWKWRAPYPITPEQKHPVPLSDLKIHLCYMLTTFISDCDASSNLFWAFFLNVFPFLSLLFTKRFAMSSGISKWIWNAAAAWGRERNCLCVWWLDRYANPHFTRVSLASLATAILVVIINLVVLKGQELYPGSLRSSVTLHLRGIKVTKAKKRPDLPSKISLLICLARIFIGLHA